MGLSLQGLFNAMFEQIVHDENGQCLTADFENYKLATAADMPNIEVTHSTTKCQHTPLSQRGLGEGIPGPVTGALSNSVCDALAPFGIEINELPLRPNMVWRLLQKAKMKDAADGGAPAQLCTRQRRVCFNLSAITTVGGVPHGRQSS